MNGESKRSIIISGLFLVGILTFALGSSMVWASPWNVVRKRRYTDHRTTRESYPSSNFEKEIIKVPENYSTIQEAIDAASDGDTILVEDGTYESVTVNKSLVLMGEGWNTIIDADGEGDVVEIKANNVTVTGFVIRGSGSHSAGIRVYYGGFNTIQGNIIIDNYYGVEIYDSTRNVFRENNVTNNQYNFRVWGLYLSHFLHDIDASNIVNSNPVYYLINQSGRVVSSSAGYVAVVNSVNVTVKNLQLRGNEQGVLLAYSRECVVKNVTASRNKRGIHLLRSDNNTLKGNRVEENGWGIFLDCSRYNLLEDNQLSNNSRKGILLSFSQLLYESKNNVIRRNQITHNGNGIYLDNSDNNTVSKNMIAHNNRGVALDSATYNTVYGNKISENHCGVWLQRSDDNHFYHNNFVSNRVDVNNYYSGSVCIWDDGYPSGGNYWSGYNSTDLHTGSDQNTTGRDGIYDTPYTIDEDNRDKYPLTDPLTIFEAGSYDPEVSWVYVVSNSNVSDFHFNPDEGPFLTFTVANEDGGFCRIGIPKNLIWVEEGSWSAWINQLPVTARVWEDLNHTYLYLNYSQTEAVVKIQGTNVIPEFPLTTILPLLIIMTSIATGLVKQRRWLTEWGP